MLPQPEAREPMSGRVVSDNEAWSPHPYENATRGKTNPRRSNGHRRDELRRWLASQQLPCALCGKPIDYSLTTWVDPRDGKVKRHPMSFEVDEIVPVSKGGDPLDRDNVQPAHRICNQTRGNKTLKPGRSRREGAGHDAGAVSTFPWSQDW